MTQFQALLLALLLFLMAVVGAVWQFGPYGLYGGAFVGAVVLTFINVEKGGRSDG